MKKITLIFIISAMLTTISCSSIRTALNSGNTNSAKSKYVYTGHPNNIKNAKSDAHTGDETAIFVTIPSKENYYVGKEMYSLDVVGEYVKKLLDKTPAEKQLVYLNADERLEYIEAVKVIDSLRKLDIENLGLIVSAETSTVRVEPPFHVLKVKVSSEPKEIEDEDWYEKNYLNMTKDGKISFARYDKKVGFKPDKAEIKPEELEAQTKQFFKDQEEKKIFRKGTNEIDKRIFIRATRATLYRQVVQMVDAAIGAGADVYLQIDDLES